MSAKVRIGIIGYGIIGATHREAIAAQPDAEVVAVARRAPLNEADAPEWYASHHALLQRDDIDLVVICTPSGLHVSQALDALAAGKGVVIEKPIALTVEDGVTVLERARETGQFLSVISQRRTEVAVQAAQRALTNGALGRPVLGEALVRWSRDQSYYDSAEWRGTRALDGGVMLNQAIHAIDLLTWLFGPVEEVAGVTATRIRQMEAEDTAVASLRFRSGALGSITATTAIPSGTPAEINLFCEHGSISLHDTGIARWDVPGIPTPVEDGPGGSGSTNPVAIGKLGHQRQWRDILDAYRGGTKPLVTGEDGVAAVAVIAAIEESHRSGRPVRPEFVLEEWSGGRA